MTRGWDSSFSDELRGVNPKPTILLEITTGLTSAGDEYIRLTSDETDRSWPSTGGNTFTARSFEVSGYAVRPDEYEEFRVTCPDVDAYFSTWLASTDFRWQRITRIMIDRDLVTATTYAQSDTFRIVNIAQEDRLFRFVCEPLAAILQRVRVPARTMTREDFPGMPTEGVIR